MSEIICGVENGSVYWERVILGCRKMILSGLGIYAALSAITYLLFQEFSFRHSIFLLVVAILSISSSALFERKRMYLR